ncbi:REP-associated tyrosine transposase [Pluralibacter gergoviae]|nr:transposase [Pluralibacter gergoviae]
MSNYRRSYIPGGSWFFTVNLKNRRSHLLIDGLAALREAIATVRKRKPFIVDAWVILPDHMHCIWTLPEGDSDDSGRWRDIKKRFTRTLHGADIWQPRFWEHTIRDSDDFLRHKDYCYINPVKHGWVRQVRNWPYSTFHRDVRRGCYPIDWAGECVDFTTGERR